MVGIRVRLKKPSGNPPTARQHAAVWPQIHLYAGGCVGRKRDRAAFEYEFQFVEATRHEWENTWVERV